MIALCRLVLAAVFFLSMWIDPAQPVRAAHLGYTLVEIYLGLSILLMVLALTSWWWDHCLAWPVMVVDVAAFLAAVFFTESVGDDFTSPFLAFFTFLLLAVTVRWDWRVTATTGLAVTALYLLVGSGLVMAGTEMDILRFGRRVAYMIVLLLILIWFGLQRREQQIGRFTDAAKPETGLAPPLESALAFALEQSGARAGAIAWSDEEEPGIELRGLGIPFPDNTVAPIALPADRAFGDKARLFSANRRRTLRASTRGRPVALSKPQQEPLADLLGLGEALVLPFSSGTGRGEILLTGIPGVCSDHVTIGSLIAREVSAAFDRHATLVLSHHTALVRSRDALARDLHDSVAQSLAGAALRLEGLRTTIRADDKADVDAELVELKRALRAEQEHVRGLIGRLREAEEPSAKGDLATNIGLLAEELSRNWRITIRVVGTTPTVPKTITHDFANLLREGVANAVRHGRANLVRVELLGEEGAITMIIQDNGSGFPAGTSPDAPRSIRERVARLGGALAAQSTRSGTRLTISVPSGDWA